MLHVTVFLPLFTVHSRYWPQTKSYTQNKRIEIYYVSFVYHTMHAIRAPAGSHLAPRMLHVATVANNWKQ